MSTTLLLAAYRAATRALEPFAPWLLARRAARGREDRARLSERLGNAGRARPEGPLIWFHGVSVGESVSLLPLVEALQRERPELGLLVTTGTLTSAQVMANRLPRGAVHQFATIDTPRAVSRFLAHWRPDLAILVESELWPNLIGETKASGAKLALVSARITEASAERWRKAPASARALFSAFDLILPQDAASAERLGRLGAHVGPLANLKQAGTAPPCDEAALAEMRRAIGPRKVILAASTHPGEEALVAEAFRALGCDDALLIIAPRHPDRGEALAAELRAPRRSLDQPPTERIYVADTLGEMGLFYRLADVVVMGGAFASGVGGHNPLEAARLGRPILSGPHAFNAAEAYADLYARAAAIRADDAASLTRHLRGLLANPPIARRMGEAGADYAEAQGRALEVALAQLKPLLPAPRPC